MPTAVLQSEHEIGTGMITIQYGDKKARRDGLIRLNIRCRETKSVAEALIVTNKRARRRCGFPQGGKPSKGVGRPTVPHSRKVNFSLEDAERDWPLEQAETRTGCQDKPLGDRGGSSCLFRLLGIV